jgi:hypothetical protein
MLHDVLQAYSKATDTKISLVAFGRPIGTANEDAVFSCR